MQPQNNIPSIKQPGNWSPLDNYTNDLPPPPKNSLFSRYKKLIIITSLALVLLVGLAVVASLTSKKSSSGYIEGPTTTVALNNYQGQQFAMKYPKSLTINSDEAIDDTNWILLLGDTSDPKTKLSIGISSDKQPYIDSADGLQNSVDEEYTIGQIETSDIVLAGNKAEKSASTILDSAGKEYWFGFAMTQQGDQSVIVQARYPSSEKDLIDSFDAVIGSIKLK